MSLPISQTRPKRSAAANADAAIVRSLKEQDKAPEEPPTKRARAEDEDMQTPAKQAPAKRSTGKAVAKVPSAKAALKAAPPADVAANKPAE